MANNISALDSFLSRITPIGDLFVIMDVVSNWPDILLFRFGLKKKISITFKTGREVEISSKKEFYEFVHGTKLWAVELARLNPKIKIAKSFVKIKFNAVQVKLHYNSLTDLGNAAGLGIEQFVWEEYKWLDVKGRDVIDIGACIGDSAIYFALKKAKHVYAIEPFPASYKMARKNISANGLNKKITLINSAIADKHGAIMLTDDGNTSSIPHLKEHLSDSGIRIGLFTLKELVDKYGIQDGALKIDTEGEEYGIIMSSSADTLRHFSQIELEYHYGYLDIENRLKEAGFTVRHTVPKYSGYDYVDNSDMYVGLLLANRDSRIKNW